jgi:elongation factor G
MGELHLDIKVDILKRTYKVEANIGAPQVAYREKITRAVTVDYQHKKQTGGTGQFAQIKIVCEPLPAGTGFVFENEVVGGAVPKEFIPGVEKGLASVLGAGVLAGFPVVDMKVEVVTVAEYTGSVIGDLNSRRGHIQGQDVRGNANVISAMVPLANMFSYVNNLRSMSQGRATFTMQFDHYEQVPNNVAQEVQAKYA